MLNESHFVVEIPDLLAIAHDPRLRPTEEFAADVVVCHVPIESADDLATHSAYAAASGPSPWPLLKFCQQTAVSDCCFSRSATLLLISATKTFVMRPICCGRSAASAAASSGL